MTPCGCRVAAVIDKMITLHTGEIKIYSGAGGESALSNDYSQDVRNHDAQMRPQFLPSQFFSRGRALSRDDLLAPCCPRR